MSEGKDSRKRARSPSRPLLDGYRPIPGVPDEMLDETGAPRPAWAQLIAALDELGPAELRKRFARADQYLRDAGVYYRVYDKPGANEREWPLSHLPLLIAEVEWQVICEGLIQRADLFERVVADIYGDNMLVREGLLPPGLIAASPEYLRPLVGVRPAGGHFLHFCAFELGRGPDGNWWVLGDRMQAPSGAGFALENRVATTRALSDIYGDMHVHRLAGFFRRFRDALVDQVSDPEGRVAILTPGPLNETYYEHAYIARYLGIMLLEGEDLTVANGRLMVRTVSGLRPVSVLWRRLDAAFADPLELNPASRIGTPGLAQAVRQRSVTVVNALGSGVMETRSFLAFMPRICQAMDGHGLSLPSIATWWCGQATEREHVIANLDTMMIGPALSTRLPFEDEEATRLGASLSVREKDDLIARLRSHGEDYVAQEAVTLSTTPVFSDGKLVPRPAAVRVYLARTPQGWVAMPGGFARIGQSADTSAIAMQRGGKAADVWVVSDKPVERETLLPSDTSSVRRRLPGTLPSRAAENLNWLGRYVERAENTVRALRAYHVRLAETDDPELPLLADLEEFMEPLGIDMRSAIPAGLVSMVDSAIYSAGHIRDRFSPDGWLALRDLSKTLHKFARTVEPGDDAARAMTVLLRKIAGFSGLLHENMYRFTGWRFLEIGRRLERAIQISRTLARLTREDAPDGAFDLMLEIGDSVLTHRRQYTVQSGRRTVVDLLALDPLNPRAVLYQLERLKHEIDHLPNAHRPNLSVPAKEVWRLHTDLAIREADEMDSEALERIAFDVSGLYEKLSATYFG